MTNAELHHHEPIVEFAAKKGRRTFLLLGSVALVLGAMWIFVTGLADLTAADSTGFFMWLSLIIGPMGMLFFGFVGSKAARELMGPVGKIGFVVSPVGFTDRSQVVGPAGVVPWSYIGHYDVVVLMGQPLLIMELVEPEAYVGKLGSARLKQLAFKRNTDMLGEPVHAVTLKHLHADQQEILDAVHRMTGVPPGSRSEHT